MAFEGGGFGDLLDIGIACRYPSAELILYISQGDFNKITVYHMKTLKISAKHYTNIDKLVYNLFDLMEERRETIEKYLKVFNYSNVYFAGRPAGPTTGLEIKRITFMHRTTLLWWRERLLVDFANTRIAGSYPRYLYIRNLRARKWYLFNYKYDL